MNELGLIDAFLEPFQLTRYARRSGAGVLSGPGDDCAVVRPSRGHELVLKVDELVQGVHFDPRWFAPEDVGHKALAAALSDLAAAGARPRWFLCALGVRTDSDPVPVVRGMARGMAALARRHRCALVGGNVTKAGAWSISVTALGEAARPRTRSGARPGHALVIAGDLGRAALGLRLLPRDGNGGGGERAWREGEASARRTREESAAISAQLRPEPLVAAGLAATGLAAAAVDVSDGFLRDLGHLCEASGCGAEVDVDDLPIDAAVRATDIELALSGGEDYALLFAARPQSASRLVAALNKTRTPARVAGRFVKGRGIRLSQGGSPRALPPRLGWDHLE
ncbi:MAG TPA: thiamine-phosphate kinase [Myxococcales bacterium]|nr:thiamine-phosphate kinase [Myxococcales bacterium]